MSEETINHAFCGKPLTEVVAVPLNGRGHQYYARIGRSEGGEPWQGVFVPLDSPLGLKIPDTVLLHLNCGHVLQEFEAAWFYRDLDEKEQREFAIERDASHF